MKLNLFYWCFAFPMNKKSVWYTVKVTFEYGILKLSKTFH